MPKPLTSEDAVAVLRVATSASPAPAEVLVREPIERAVDDTSAGICVGRWFWPIGQRAEVIGEAQNVENRAAHDELVEYAAINRPSRLVRS